MNVFGIGEYVTAFGFDGTVIEASDSETIVLFKKDEESFKHKFDNYGRLESWHTQSTLMKQQERHLTKEETLKRCIEMLENQLNRSNDKLIKAMVKIESSKKLIDDLECYSDIYFDEISISSLRDDDKEKLESFLFNIREIIA